MHLLNVETISPESVANILKTGTDLTDKFLPLLISQICSTVNTEEPIERVTDLLCAIISNYDTNISEEILNGVECILNSLVVKIFN